MTLCEYKSSILSQVNQDKLVCYSQPANVIYGLKCFEKHREEKGEITRVNTPSNTHTHIETSVISLPHFSKFSALLTLALLSQFQFDLFNKICININVLSSSSY